MTTLDRRHRGRAIRRNHQRHPGTGLVFVSVIPDISAFARAMESARKSMARFSRAYKHPRQILHNGRKPR